ncbi:hypothetical protein NDU88_006383 [Pleurodeles waltl]|uniref:Uncharacterized protein n=1 Tax=Pleurodeles waltl TaxID=8319 RepID=A0AAV7TX35_PLEWA|nr:hypothetical protein NDU88_006383 [Pleurodeles waltl]
MLGIGQHNIDTRPLCLPRQCANGATPKTRTKRRVSCSRPKTLILGTPTLEQAKIEQSQVLNTAGALWTDRRSPPEASLDNDAAESASINSEDSMTSQLLSNVTLKMADEIL